MKNLITFVLILFGAMVVDMNIYLGLLCVAAGLVVGCVKASRTA